MALIGTELLRQWSLLDVASLPEQDLIGAVEEISHGENVLAGLKTRLLGRIEELGLAAELGYTSTTAWLTNSGRVDPGAARRQIGVAMALDKLTFTADFLREGEISGAHAEAIVAAIAAIDAACPNLPRAGRDEAEATLIEVALTESPAKVREKGRELLLALQPDRETACEDPARNRLDYGVGRDGRGKIRGDLDRLAFEKLRAALEPLTAPRPEPDGAPDARPVSQRRADALVDLLDTYLAGGESSATGGRRTHVTLLANAQDLAGRGRFVHNLDDPDLPDEQPGSAPYRDLFNAPWPFRLSWTGSVSRQVAQLLACDCDITVVLIDGNEVPLDVGRRERLVTKEIRQALIVRDGGCAVPGCGRPPQWCDAHHIREWINGGETSLANMVLLCKRHHAMIHRKIWEVFIGEDGHPWFIPPRSIDLRRRPVPAHNRGGAIRIRKSA